MRHLLLARLARADLIGIGDYSQRIWGVTRKVAYMIALFERMQRLRVRPMASASREEFAPGVRAARSGRHLIFFLHDPQQVTVLTILHERANAKAHVIRAIKLAEKI